MDLLGMLSATRCAGEISAIEALARLTGLQRRALEALIAVRRGVGGVMTTPPALLRAFGVREEAVEIVASAACLARMLAREEAVGAPVLSAWDKVLAYVRTELAHEGTERCLALFLDRKNALIAAETVGTGTVDHAPVYPREIVKRALLLCERGHPGAQPSLGRHHALARRYRHDARRGEGLCRARDWAS